MALLDHNGRQVGTGDQALAALWDGEAVIGAISTDNLLSAQHIDGDEILLLEQFAQTTGHLGTRLRLADALRASERRRGLLAAIVESSDDAIISADLQGRITNWNGGAENLFGFRADEAIQQPLAILAPPNERKQLQQVLADIQAGRHPVTFEAGHMHKDGRRIDVWGNAAAVRDETGSTTGFCAILRDMTTRREAERRMANYQKQLQMLTFDLCLTEERERRSLAVNLHDGLGQMLAATKIKMELLERSAEPHTADALRLITAVVADMHAIVRSLTFELSPPVLHDLGLSAAVQWLIEQVERDHGLRVALQFDGQADTADERLRIVLSRVMRELLLNVAKHAGSGEASIHVQAFNGTARVVVEDAGKGFDPASTLNHERPRTFGLLSARERLEALGGTMQIRSSQGHGARIELTVPLRQSQEE